MIAAQNVVVHKRAHDKSAYEFLTIQKKKLRVTEGCVSPIVAMENDENNNAQANLKVFPRNILQEKPKRIPLGVVSENTNANRATHQPSLYLEKNTDEYRLACAAAQTLMKLSYETNFVWNPTETKERNAPEKLSIGLAHASKKPKSSIPVENNPLDGEAYRRKAQNLLFMTSDILVGERKDAFFELVKTLCPYIDIVRSGSKTLRTYLVDTRKKKRYRTYSDAIKGGALDPLLIETGTTVLLRGCVEEAIKRFELINAKKEAEK